MNEKFQVRGQGRDQGLNVQGQCQVQAHSYPRGTTRPKPGLEDSMCDYVIGVCTVLSAVLVTFSG